MPTKWNTGLSTNWLSVNYEPVPLLIAGDEAETTLATSSVTASSVTLTIANHGGTAWYYKSTTTDKTTSTAVAANTASVNVTGPIASTQHIFSVSSASTCTMVNCAAQQR